MTLTVLHVTTAFRPHAVGGAEVVVSTLARAQAAAGYRTFITHLSPAPAPRYVEDGVTIIPLSHRNLYDIKTHSSKPAIMRRINKFYSYYNPGVLAEIESLLASLNPDIVHTHSLVDLSTQIWRRAKRKSVRVVHTLHDYDLLCGRSSLFRDGNCKEGHLHVECRVHARIKQLALDCVDSFVSISDYVFDQHKRIGAFGPEELRRTTTVWNPLSAAPQFSGNGSEAALSERPLRLGFIGRLVPDKGIGLLLDELRELGRTADWTLDVGGVAPNGDQWLRDKARALPVNFSGWVKTEDFMQGIDVLIVPSIWNEPFGLTVVEGLLTGKIVLGSRRGAIPEILNGLGPDCLFDPDVAGDLARLVGRVLDGPNSFRPKAAYLETLAQRLHPDFVRDAYDRVYCHTLERTA